MKRILAISVGVLVCALLVLILPLRRVGSNDMGWTFQEGDLVWVFPTTIYKGDVVVFTDPLDPQRTVMRRVVALAGDKVRYEDGTLRISGKRIRQTDMGMRGDVKIFKEVIWSRPPARATNWYIRRVDRPVLWTLDDPVTIPEGHVFVMADNRDEALDSRWWGPIPTDNIHGVVRARYGEPDDWRGALQWFKPIDQRSTEDAQAELDEAAAE